MHFQKLKQLAFAALGALVLAPPALAQDYPTRPIEMVVPFAPGGATDILARILGQKLSEGLGQEVVISNKPGAGTAIGNNAVAKAAPDGYTLLFAVTPFVISQVLDNNLPYDPEADFAPVTLVALTPQSLVVNPSLNVNTVQELVALAKSKPGGLNFASAGNGTVTHLAGELFNMRAGTDIVHVPYAGGGPAAIATMAGEVAMEVAAPSEVKQYVDEGKLRIIAVASAKRLDTLPDVPTIIESGYPDFEVNSFFAILAPAGTPDPILQRIGKEMAKVMEAPDVKERLAALSAFPQVGTPQELASFLQAERTKWKEVAKNISIPAK